MRTTGGQPSSREAALAMIAQVERNAAAISRRHASDDAILDSFTDFRTFIDKLSEFHLFLDMVGNRLRSIEPDERAAQVRKLAIIRWNMMEIEVEVSSQFLDRMATSGKPWPMGSQKFLRRRVTRLEDISEFHAAHAEEYELASPNAGLMQNIRDRVDAQIDKSVPLADFGTDAPPEALPEAPPPPSPPQATVIEAPAPPVQPPPVQPPPVQQQVVSPPPIQPRPATPAAAPQPELLIPGMLAPGPFMSKPLAAKPSASEDAGSGSSQPAAPIPKPPSAAPLMPDVLIPGMLAPAPPTAVAPPPAELSPPPAPPASPSSAPAELMEFAAEQVAEKAKEVARLAAKPAPKAGKKPAGKQDALGMARRDFRLKVRDDADGYQYIEGNGLAVVTEACRIANIAIDDLARTLELSRPGLTLILNGRDPAAADLLKVLRRLVLRAGGLA